MIVLYNYDNVVGRSVKNVMQVCVTSSVVQVTGL